MTDLITWTNKPKTDESGDYTNKTKISAITPTGYLLTPDNNKILVGEYISETLIYQEEFERWSNKPKTDESSSWINKGKISV